MTAFPFAAIGFDLDGTLVDSNRDLGPSINHALRLFGRDPIAPEDTRRLIGGGARLMLQRAFDLTGGPLADPDFEEAHAAQQAYYGDHIADLTEPYPGCLDALDRLAELGCRLAVVTNKSEHFAVRLLEELGMSARFTCVLGGDTLGRDRAKPAPDMILEAMRRCGSQGRFAMVGDSSYDVRAARAAGVPCLVFSFGYNDAPAHELGADAVLNHFDELAPALERLQAVDS
jgi:phosphoglycolate phosphatase